MTDWKSLVQQHGPLVWRTVYRLVSHHADACDCFQETFLAYVKLARRQEIDEPGAILRTIATSRAIDRLRERVRNRTRFESLPEDSIANSTSDPSARSEQAEEIARLREGLAQLPPKQAQVYCLRFVEDLSYEQIARTMGITLDSAGVLLHRAKERLRELLAPSESRR